MTQPQLQPTADPTAQTIPFGANIDIPDAPAPGRFVWHDLNTTDPTRAIAFYTALLGWKTVPMDMGAAGTYTMLYNGEEGVGGIADASTSLEKRSYWLSYITVRGVDAAVERAIELGGTAPFPPADIPDVGRFAIITDPTGASFSPFRSVPGRDRPEGGQPPVGSFIWFELLTKDPETAAHFYDEIFAWTHRVEDMGALGKYYLFMRGGKDVAGLMPMPATAEGPVQWVPYIHVADVDASAARVTELGGTVYVAPADIPNVGRFSVCADPTGATFSLYKPLPR